MKDSKFVFIAIAPTGDGISGSDRIFIELARQWSKNIPVTVYTTQEGVDMIERQKLKGKSLRIMRLEKNDLPTNFLLKYLYKIILGINLGFSLSIKQKGINNNQIMVHNTVYLYSSSDFWMDVIPAVILKLRHNRLKWIATWYQTAPNPFIGFVEPSFTNATEGQDGKQQAINNNHLDRKKKYHISAMLYWLSQLPIKPMIKVFADYVIVNNEEERKQFNAMNKSGKVIVLLGAVRLEDIDKWKMENGILPKVYDAVFQGRFHPQKGVVELVDIWRSVVDKIPNAKLAMIGDGPLRKNVELRIKILGLENNIKLFGYVFDGPEKYKIFAQSKIAVHPALFDSGGMAAAEAMAFGLPCVGFDLKAYKSYYPKGMLKIKMGDLHAYSKQIIELLNDKKLRDEIGKQANDTIIKNCGWDKRSKNILENIINVKE